MLTPDYLQKRLVDLEKRQQNALGQLNIIIGAIAEVKAMIDEMGKEESTEEKVDKTVDLYSSLVDKAVDLHSSRNSGSIEAS